MPGWLNTVGTFLVNLIPELIVGVVLGVVILIIEYWTGWFAEHTSIEVGNGKSGVKRVGKSLKPVIEFIGSVILGLLFLLFFAAVIYFASSGERHETILDNPDDAGTVLVVVHEGNTVSVFENDLFITVNEVNSGSVEIRKMEVDYILGKAGYENLVVEGATVGSTVTYETDSRYFIRVGSTSLGLPSYKVHFVVTILEEDGQATP